MRHDEIILLPGFQVDQIERTYGGSILIKAHSQATKAPCPTCSTLSERTHGSYMRSPQTLPILGMQTILHLKVRRFICDHSKCLRKTFAEPIDEVVPRFGRRSRRLNEFLNILAFETSAESTARICGKLDIMISADTILRFLRSKTIPPPKDVRILGVDDWAFKKNYSYGTILVDLEAQRVIDILPGRTAETLANWLVNHPEIEYIARDRSKEYRVGIERSVPKAIQIADRWHLLLNLRERIQRTLPEVLKQSRKSYSQRAIARALDLSRGTVRNYIRSVSFPDHFKGVPRPSKIDRYEAYLRRRWTQGIRSSTELWRELQALGYEGKRKSVHRYLRRFRDRHPPKTMLQLTWLFVKDQGKLSNEELDYLKCLFDGSEEVASLYQLVQRFAGIVRERQAEQLENWLLDAERSPFKPLSNFAFGLREDQDAVKNALLYPWSNGQTEGQVTRLKMIKRQMYGRANFDLLRIRILGPP
jgi:transposase